MQEYISSVRILTAVIVKGRSLDSSFTGGDSPLARQISYGVLRNFYHLTALLELLLTKPLIKKHNDLHVLLLAGLYSVDHLNRPDHTSVNAVVESAIGFKKPWAKGLLNGVLRNYLRNRAELTLKVKEIPEAFYNHPAWLYDRIRLAYPDQSSDIFEANNSHAPMTLRVNLSKIDRSGYQEKLSAREIKSKTGDLANTALILDNPVSIEQLPGFADGLVSVQDEASQLVAPIMNLSPGLSVLDACAAPGGKTCHMLEAEPTISLVAVDKDRRRLDQVKENLTRLKSDCTLVVSDLLEYSSELLFDRILLDAPCSATGIIRRHPDIKLLRRDSDIVKLAATQLKLLAKAWSLLKQNGELVYSTCSILPTENEQVIDTFSRQCESVCVLPIQAGWGENTSMGRQLLPGINSTDGFFFARLKKQSR